MAHRRSQTIRMVSSGFIFTPAKTNFCPPTSHCIGTLSFEGMMVSISTSGSVTETSTLRFHKFHITATDTPRSMKMILLLHDKGSLRAFRTSHPDKTSQRFSTRVAGEAWSPAIQKPRSTSAVVRAVRSERFISYEVAPRKWLNWYVLPRSTVTILV